MRNFIFVTLAIATAFMLGRFTAPAQLQTTEEKAPNAKSAEASVAASEGSHSTRAAGANAAPTPAAIAATNSGSAAGTANSPAANHDSRAEEPEVIAELPDQPGGQPRVDERATALQNELGFDRSMEDKLAQARRGNLLPAIQGSNYPTSMTPTLRGLIGRFVGSIYMNDQPERPWGMRIETQGAFTENQFAGRSFVQLLRNGKPFVSSSYNGQITNIRVQEGRASLLVQASDSYYLDAFYDQPSDSIYGNFYVRNSKGNFRYRGTAQLSRN